MDGSLPTVPDLADYAAVHSPTRPWFVFPSRNDPNEIVKLSCAEVAQASHRVAHIMRPGREGPEGQVVALVLNTDNVLYMAVVLGLLRAGFVPYPMSPRNTAQGVMHMLEATSCTRILGQASTVPLISQVQTEMVSKGVELRIDSLPGLEHVFPLLCGQSDNEVNPYPPAAKPVDMNAPSIYIHSSGSTGLPKSIHFTHWRMLHWMRRNMFRNVHGLRFSAMSMPTFHTMGVVFQLSLALSSGNEIAVYTPQYPAPPVVPHPQSVYETSKATKCDAIMTLPSFVEAWSHSTEIIDYLKTLKILIYSGGPLAHTVGDKLVQEGIHLVNSYGATEFGNPSILWYRVPESNAKPDVDWYWARIEEGPRTRFESQGDGTYELVMIETDEYHLGVHNVAREKAYATSDLFEPHPEKVNMWKLVGRKDDVITLSTGEKVVPIPQEGIISSSNRVAGCVMFGRQREQPGILIEPNPEDTIDPSDQPALIRLRNKLWPIIEKANEAAPAFAKIFKEMIVITDPDKPLPRAAKSNVSRKLALQIYADKIDKLYSAIAESTNVQGISPPLTWDMEYLEPWLLEQANLLAGRDKVVFPDRDLFQQGFDSLSATFFRNRIIGALRSSENPDLRQASRAVSTNILFENPTIKRLARAVQAVVNPTGQSQDPLSLRVAEVKSMIAKYAADLPSPKGKSIDFVGPPVVLLTGSTGNIGSHILAHLLEDDRIMKVYALNRPSEDPVGRLKAAFMERGLEVGLLEGGRFVSLTGDIKQDRFGLEEGLYNEVLESVTHVIHNAWTVNFNLALQSFEDQISGVRKLVDIAAFVGHPMRLLVTSSISAVNGWNPAMGSVPEHPLPDPAIAARTGYGASKYIVEQVLSAARAKGVAAMSVRMGQACGPKATGAWGTTEWMPIMVKSSVSLGYLPAIRGPVAWMPLDAIGKAYVDWVVSSEALPPLINVVHPRPTTWAVILKGLREELGDAVSIISLQDWVKKLEDRSVSPTLQDLNNIPALKLLNFFRGMSKAEVTDAGGSTSLAYDTAELLDSSPVMRELQPMTEEHAKVWVRYWKSKGFIVR